MWWNTCQNGITAVCMLSHLVVRSEIEVVVWKPGVCYLGGLCVFPKQQGYVVFQRPLPPVCFFAAVRLYPVTFVNVQLCFKLSDVP